MCLRGFRCTQACFPLPDSEELNRVLVLTMARAIRVTGYESSSSETGRWCVDFLKAIQAHTPHTFPSHTLQCLPHSIQEFYHQYQPPKESMTLAFKVRSLQQLDKRMQRSSIGWRRKLSVSCH